MSILIHQLTDQGNIFFRWRSYIPLVLLVLGLTVYYVNLSDNHVQFAGLHILGGLCLCFLGLFIRCIVVGYSAENTSGRNTSMQVADSLNTTGIYSIMRHPLYAANFFMWLGVCVMTMNIAFMAIFTLWFLLFYERIIMAEEEYLTNKFSAAYQSWVERTPLVIPDFGLWKSPNEGFSWKKVLRQEKNGFAAIFIIVFIFEIVFNYHHKLPMTNLNSIWFRLMIGTTGLYFVLKFLKYKTTALISAAA